ncbi:unnamed protein product [Protopolystoma xenopodis]|uniref:Uncharacterized protein n=1 Tax=Protopolystoma xenopodis TaxID=117903 RepID=A0A3S5BPU6_9PLAT|nr:unnamed protein product [Protopolystoma xenopodis]
MFPGSSPAGGVDEISPVADLPISLDETLDKVAAELDEPAVLSLRVQAHPPMAEAVWYRLVGSESLLSRRNSPASNRALSGRGASESASASAKPDSVARHSPTRNGAGLESPRHRKDRLPRGLAASVASEVTSLPRQRIGDRHDVAARVVARQDGLTFQLHFATVQVADYGLYVCQLQHDLGTRDFHFTLAPGGSECLTDMTWLLVASPLFYSHPSHPLVQGSSIAGPIESGVANNPLKGFDELRLRGNQADEETSQNWYKSEVKVLLHA